MLASTDPQLEFVNYYGNTSLFALESLGSEAGAAGLGGLSLLSVGCRMSHLIDYLALFRTVHHNSMTQTKLPVPAEHFAGRWIEHRCDFFTLPALDIDCVISHAAIHCFHDGRYGNSPEGNDVAEKPYLAAAALRRISNGRPVPIVVSVAVHREQGLFRDNVHLSHERFIDSFVQAGYTPKSYFFDYLCGGLPYRPEYLQPEFRRATELPAIAGSPREWVVGNYLFVP